MQEFLRFAETIPKTDHVALFLDREAGTARPP